MKRRIPERLKQKQRYSANKKKHKTEKKNFLRKLRDAFEESSIKAIVAAAASILIFLTIYLLGYTDVGTWLRKGEEAKNNFTMMQHYSVEGILVDCDSLPIPGIKVVARGYDVNPALTDEDGFFSSSMKLPVELNEIQIRFVDSTNQEIYKTLYNLDKNSVENDDILVYVIPDQFLR